MEEPRQPKPPRSVWLRLGRDCGSRKVNDADSSPKRRPKAPFVEKCGSDAAARHTQTARAIIIFLISAIALAGFNPFGQVFAQFMMVWQR